MLVARRSATDIAFVGRGISLDERIDQRKVGREIEDRAPCL